MKSLARQIVALTAIVALINPAFAQPVLAPVDAETVELDIRSMLEFPDSPIAESDNDLDGTGSIILAQAQMGARPDSPVLRIVGTQTRQIVHQATRRQREVATARARAYVAAYRRKAAQAEAASKPRPAPKTAKKTAPPKEPEAPKKPGKPGAPKTTVAKKTTPKEAPAPEPKAVAKPTPLPRYIAVDTVKDERSSPKAKKAVMVWDTHAETLVGNNVYDLEKPPPVGEAMKFETYSAEYVGAGL